MCKPSPLGLGWQGILPAPHPQPEGPLELQMGHPSCGTDQGLVAGVAPRLQQQWWANLGGTWERQQNPRANNTSATALRIVPGSAESRSCCCFCHFRDFKAVLKTFQQLGTWFWPREAFAHCPVAESLQHVSKELIITVLIEPG